VVELEHKRGSLERHAASVVRGAAKNIAKALSNGSCVANSLIAGLLREVQACAAPLLAAVPDAGCEDDALQTTTSPTPKSKSHKKKTPAAAPSTAATANVDVGGEDGTDAAAAGGGSGAKGKQLNVAPPVLCGPWGWGGWCVVDKWNLGIVVLLGQTAAATVMELAALPDQGQEAQQAMAQQFMADVVAALQRRVVAGEAPPPGEEAAPLNAGRAVAALMSGEVGGSGVGQPLLLHAPERCALAAAFFALARAAGDWQVRVCEQRWEACMRGTHSTHSTRLVNK
jgi:hypothetical protein